MTSISGWFRQSWAPQPCGQGLRKGSWPAPRVLTHVTDNELNPLRTKDCAPEAFAHRPLDSGFLKEAK